VIKKNINRFWGNQLLGSVNFCSYLPAITFFQKYFSKKATKTNGYLRPVNLKIPSQEILFCLVFFAMFRMIMLDMALQ